MKLHGWGRYPVVDATVFSPATAAAVVEAVQQEVQGPMIPRGLGRSYGDSSLASSVLQTTQMDHFLSFDDTSGELRCSAGLSLAEILDSFVPRGWFLPVTPGTRFVTVGGAIASDVHGKNHHRDGSFSEHISTMKVVTVSDGIVECSRQQFPELFHATCGGMGLTGVILEATLNLKPIRSSTIQETTIKAANLEEAVALLDDNHSAQYSVAWIDCLSTGQALGRSLLILGEHADSGELSAGSESKLAIPVEMPSALLNQYSIQAFNHLYYNRIRRRCSERRVDYQPYFYPLDGIAHWNRMYGRDGFVQYQFVIPRASGLEGMSAVLQRIAQSRRGSFLTVLKALGPDNENYLSFPMEGYTLALDFKMDFGLFALLDELDAIVSAHGGRIYLTKDARMSEAMFKSGYPDWEKFVAVRKEYGADKVFNSLQSQRLGL